MDNHAIIKQVVVETLGQIPPELRLQLKPAGAIKHVKKSSKGLDILKLTITGKTRDGFWHPDWCAYELGLGTYEGKPSWGAAGFHCFTNNAACGEGKFQRNVREILEQAKTTQLPEFGLEGIQTLSLKRTYLRTQFPEFPAALAATDLARLITSTFPQFQRLLGKTPC